jgi:hypothetical protein
MNSPYMLDEFRLCAHQAAAGFFHATMTGKGGHAAM